MAITKSIILAEMQTLLSAEITVPDPSGVPTVDSSSGVVTIPTKTDTQYNIMLDGDLKIVIEALIDALITKIESNGIIMGESKAKKLEVL